MLGGVHEVVRLYHRLQTFLMSGCSLITVVTLMVIPRTMMRGVACRLSTASIEKCAVIHRFSTFLLPKTVT